MKLPTLLFHPHVTIGAVIGCLASAASSCVAFVAALDPIEKLGFLQPYLPEITRFNGDIIQVGLVCGAVAAALGVIAGAGRSFVSAIDSPTKATNP